MEAAGVKLDLELTMFYQGLESGTGSQDYEFGSRLDGFVKLDTGKMGLWKGGGLVSHLEYRTGDLPGALGGTFFPTNSGMEFPSDSPDKLVATSLYLSSASGSAPPCCSARSTRWTCWRTTSSSAAGATTGS